MKILSIDSSATCASVALYDTQADKTVGEFFINTRLTHSQTLIPMLDALMNSTKTEFSDIDYFAVNTGPGSFTGIRIGVSAVKGIAMALEKPCVGISTLESMAYNCVDFDDIIVCACMDARRNQVYNALFEVKSGFVNRLCDDRAISTDELILQLREMKKNIILVGDGAHLIDCSSDSNISLAHDNKRYQKASSVCLCAKDYIDKNNVVSASALMPTYLRPSQAERERLQKEEGK